MKNRSSKKKIIKKIILLIILLIIILTIIIGILYTKSDFVTSKRKLNYIYSEEWNDEIYPEGMPKLFRNYSGKLTAQNIGKSIYYVSNEVIPKYYIELKQSSDEEIKEYYKKNKKTMYIDIGEIKEDKFLLLINEINKINRENIEFEEYYINKDSIKAENDSIKADLYIKYKDSKEICLKVQVLSDFRNDSSSVKYYK